MSYGRVYEEFWDGEKIKPLSDRAALLGLYLITGEHRNAIGCFRLGKGAISDIPRFGVWGFEGVSKALMEMVETGFIERDDATGWTLIPNALIKDPVNSPNAARHAVALAAKVPDNTLVYKRLMETLAPQLEPYEKHLKSTSGWPLQAPSKALRTPLPSPEPEPSPEDSDPKGSAAISSSKLIYDLGKGLLAKADSPPKNPGAIITRWLGDHGEDAVLEALRACERKGTPEPVAFITGILKKRKEEAAAPERCFGVALREVM